jgi:valyl-tRNA synthetase
LPIIGRDLIIIADEFVDPAFGTGAVKVTPAHDPNDFQMGKRHKLPEVAVIDEDGRITPAGGPFAGLDRFKARAGVVERLEAEGLLVKVVDHQHAVGTCQRCSTVVEPLVSTQWFVKIAPLAQEAIRVVENGQVRFLPENWTKTYYEWMYNIHDWCISRQLWWGHRIPAWYCESCSRMIVAEQAPERCACGGALKQDSDVLDTWFSSQLWPFSTMGWPDTTEDFLRYYPTDLMLTAFDIIFFWVARMIMAGVKFTGAIPFRDVYITGLVRDERGQKMSKSKGNVVDPLEVMDEIGADALRFTLTAMAAPGMDIPLSEGRMTGYRQFINKIWNASRFALMNLGDDPVRAEVPEASSLGLAHRWILHRLNAVTGEVQDALTTYRFDVAADRLYHFFWHEYADWYIEMVKQHLQANGAEHDTACAVLVEVHDHVLRLLHPIIPFVTEELWQHLPRRAEDGQTITLAAFPTVREDWVDAGVEAEIGLLQDVVTTIRTARAERSVKPSERISATIEGAKAEQVRILTEQKGYVLALAGLTSLALGAAPAGSDDALETVTRVCDDLRVHIRMPKADRGAEIEKLRKKLAEAEREITGIDAKLANENFLSRAPAKLVDNTRSRRQALEVQVGKIRHTLAEMGA